MTRIICGVSLAIALTVLGVGCGPNKPAEPPKQNVPLIKDGPKAAGGGQTGGQPAGGQQKGNKANIPAGTAQ